MLDGAVGGDIPGDAWPTNSFGEAIEGKEGVDPWRLLPLDPRSMGGLRSTRYDNEGGSGNGESSGCSMTSLS